MGSQYYKTYQGEKRFHQVEADEVTYPAHIILRFELEQAAIKGDLQMSDLQMPGTKVWRRYLVSNQRLTVRDVFRIFTGMMVHGDIFQPIHLELSLQRNYLLRPKQKNLKFLNP